MADFMDALGQGIINRVNQAAQPFTDPMAYLNNRVSQAAQPFTDPMAYLNQANAKPISTTINYGDNGEQTVTTKHEVTPTPTTNYLSQGYTPPVAPGLGGQPQMPTIGPAVPSAMPSAQSVAGPVMPGPAQQIPLVAPNTTPTTYSDIAAGTPVQTAGGMGTAPQTNNAGQVTAPATPINPSMPTSSAGMTPVSESQVPAPSMTPEQGLPPSLGAPPAWQSQLSEAGNDPTKLAAYVGNISHPESARKEAGERWLKLSQKEKEEEQAQDLITRAGAGEVKANNDLARHLSRRSEEGSFIKAYLLNRLGFPQQASEELDRALGKGSMSTATVGNENYAIEKLRSGEIIRAFDSKGNLVDNNTLAKINAEALSMKGAATGQTMGKDAQGHIISHTILPNGAGVRWFDETAQKQLPGAPSGYSPVGQINPLTKSQIAIAQAHIKSMHLANDKAKAAGAVTMPYSQAEIDAEESNLYNGGTPSPRATQALVNNPESTTTVATNPNGNTVDQMHQAVLGQESSGKHYDQNGKVLTSIDGAKGVGQIMPDTFKTYQSNGVIPKEWNIDNPEQNRSASRLILDDIHRKNGGNLDQTLAQYFGGPNAVNRNGSINWNLKDGNGVTVRQYVDGVRSRMGEKISAPTASSITEGTWSTPESNRYAQLNPTAAKIASYDIKRPSSTSPGSASIMRDVLKINPDYSESKFDAAKKTREDFAVVRPNSGGGQLQSVNRAIPHLAQYEEAVTALNNGRMPFVNSILQQYGYNVGDDRVAAAQAIQGLVSTEVQKAVAGGLGGVEERSDLKNQLGTNLNPQQLARVIKEYQNLMVEQARGLKQTWTSNGLPAKEFDNKLVPKTRAVFDRHEKDENNKRGNW
jgi:Transglycosylase SLT domain